MRMVWIMVRSSFIHSVGTIVVQLPAGKRGALARVVKGLSSYLFVRHVRVGVRQSEISRMPEKNDRVKKER